MKKLGYRFIPLSEVYAAQEANVSLNKTVSLTTDDGFSSNFFHLFPLLKKHKLPLTLFLTTKCINNQALAWNHKWIVIRKHTSPDKLELLLKQHRDSFQLTWSDNPATTFNSVSMGQKDALADLLWKEAIQDSQEEFLARERPFLSLEQLGEMLQGNVELGSHTVSHPFCNSLSYADLKSEIQDSCQVLEQISGKKTNLFAYPYGIRTSQEQETRIKEELGLKAMLGLRFSIRLLDHPPQDRIRMEDTPKRNYLEFTIKPLGRSIKDLLRLH
ncbi:MAG: polysaccharide deacetylase family protein [Candidatus Cloacimonetes bacterium]|nr:polysaccharide deacetylase family protein [Candidatus Cloacimonadota bacterium]